MTIPLTLVSFFFAMIIAVVVALVQYANVPVLRQIARFYIWVIRGTPLLVQLFIIFYGLPSLGIMLDAFPAAVIAFAFNEGAYCAETMRGALESRAPGPAGSRLLRRHELGADHAPHRAAAGFAHRRARPVQLPHRHDQGHLAGVQHHGGRAVHGRSARGGRTYIFLPIYCEVAVVYLLFCTVITKLQAVLEHRLNARGFQ